MTPGPTNAFETQILKKIKKQLQNLRFIDYVKMLKNPLVLVKTYFMTLAFYCCIVVEKKVQVELMVYNIQVNLVAPTQ